MDHASTHRAMSQTDFELNGRIIRAASAPDMCLWTPAESHPVAGAEKIIAPVSITPSRALRIVRFQVLRMTDSPHLHGRDARTTGLRLATPTAHASQPGRGQQENHRIPPAALTEKTVGSGREASAKSHGLQAQRFDGSDGWGSLRASCLGHPSRRAEATECG
jgi:hypothetical protein